MSDAFPRAASPFQSLSEAKMTDVTTTTPTRDPLRNVDPPASWELPKLAPAHLDEQTLADWQTTATAVRAFALKHVLSRNDVAKRANVPPGTFYPWYDGTYKGVYANITARVRQWLDLEAEQSAALPIGFVEPDFVDTKCVREVLNVLLYAQALPGMVLITLGPGMGKTTAIQHVKATRPNTYSVVMRPSTRSVASLLREIGAAIGVRPCHAREQSKLIGEKLQRNGRHTLLMIDEAQNLGDDAVNELRYFLDEFRCGIALLGNEDVHTRWGQARPREGYGQLHRRIDSRVRRLNPPPEDIDTFVAACGIDDPTTAKLLRAIGMKAGAFGQIVKTLKLAGIYARGHGRAVTAEDVREAWRNRAGEEIRS